MGQEGHAEVMSIEHKRTGKVYRRHMTKGLLRVRLGVLVNKSLRVLVDKAQLKSADRRMWALCGTSIHVYKLYINKCGRNGMMPAMKAVQSRQAQSP